MTGDNKKDDSFYPIHPILDEIPLTAKAFRVFVYIAKQSGTRTGDLDMSCQEIGDKCFACDRPECPDTRREWAILATRELRENRLLAEEEGNWIIPSWRSLNDRMIEKDESQK